MQNQTVFAYKKIICTHFMRSLRTKERNNSGNYVHLMRLYEIYVLEVISSVLY